MESTITTAWQRVLDEPAFRDLPYKVETTETGQIILSPHKPWHSLQQGRIMRLLLSHMQEPGEPAVEFAVETRKGVKVPDVVWISKERVEALPEDVEASPFAPEICVEVLSSAIPTPRWRRSVASISKAARVRSGSATREGR